MEEEKKFDSLSHSHSMSLLKRLSEIFGRPLMTSSDYIFLAETITSRTGEYVSPTTLKRIGGYLKEPVATRRTTLDLLSRAVGYRDFSDFCDCESASERDSDPSAGHWLDVLDMNKGEMVELTWFPDRRCRIRYLGEDLWEIIESESTRLRVGQRFHCSHLIEGEPLQILLEPSEFVSKHTPYLCGKMRGVRFRILSKD